MAEPALQKDLPEAQQERPPDPNVQQRRAAAPLESVWVNASAGTGKTKVLTDRVLRLLLPGEDGRQGTAPHKILCLTFTKAGAGEMVLRVSEFLSKWAVLPEEQLVHDKKYGLETLLGRAPTAAEIGAARQLFAQVVDHPGGLNIMTIHSFCQSVLGRFPLEARLPPHFTVLEDSQAAALLGQARGRVFENAQKEPLKSALACVAEQVNEEDFLKILRAMTGERRQMEAQGWGADGLYTSLCAALDVVPGRTEDDLIMEACQDGACDAVGLRKACAALAEGTEKTDRPNAMAIQQWLDGLPEERKNGFDAYKTAFLTQKNEIKKTLATKGVLNILPECGDILSREAQRLRTLVEDISKSKCAAMTRDLFLLGREIIEEYQRLKLQQGQLDYDDLINRTLDLLEGRTMNMRQESAAAWVMYKLDQGIDHILIDEAQDTNPEQWKIISALCEEFFSGVGRDDSLTRTVFVVGDEKQSIYSFQRADPQEFSRMRACLQDKIEQSGKALKAVALDISFRSTKSVLQLVDQVFSSPAIAAGLGQEPIRHRSFRLGQAGMAELWPLFEDDEREERDPWAVPTEIIEHKSGAAKMAEHIAKTVDGWIGKEELPSHGRTVQPGDIMILVRTRNALVTQMMRELKKKNIPVSGADRMVLNDQLAVEDLLAMAQFALLPEDDLSLACILKSPLMGWSEEDLYTLAVDRVGSLWAALEKSGRMKDVRYLKNLIDAAGKEAPFEFFSGILQGPCPGDETRTGLRAIKKRLGDDALDPLDELLNAALAFEADHIPSLQGFVHWQKSGAAEIKREMEEKSGQVRIMTVHGAKGLQAPIVILPDTIRVSHHVPGQPARRLQWMRKSGLDVPLWWPRKDDEPALFSEMFETAQEESDAEYRRLFYVAMTRAEDRLYIGGYKGRKEPMADCWYNYARAGFEAMEEAEVFDDGRRRISNPQTREADRKISETGIPGGSSPLPGWLFEPAPEEPDPPTPLVPSRPSEPEQSVLSPLGAAENHRFLRGNITHKLFQFLPDLPADKRLEAAKAYIEKHGGELSEQDRKSVLTETFGILESPEFADLFAPGSRAEVPVSGLLSDKRLLSGQIDRLVVKDDVVWIIDYKTGRSPPGNKKDVPILYQNQMRAYRDAICEIYPEHEIKCVLLWTDGPVFMSLDLT